MAIGRIPEPGTGIPESIIAAKGDILTGTANDTPAVLSVGTNGHTLVADSSTATGLKWAAPAGGGLVLISSTTIGSAVGSVTVTGAFSSTYDNYRIILSGGSTSDPVGIRLQLGSTTTGYYSFALEGSSSGSTVTGTPQSNVAAFIAPFTGGTNAMNGICDLQSPNLAKRTVIYATRVRSETPGPVVIFNGFENSNTQHTDFKLDIGGGSTTMTGGTIKVYGYANS